MTVLAAAFFPGAPASRGPGWGDEFLRSRRAVVRGKSVGGEVGSDFWKGQRWDRLPAPGQKWKASSPFPFRALGASHRSGGVFSSIP